MTATATRKLILYVDIGFRSIFDLHAAFSGLRLLLCNKSGLLMIKHHNPAQVLTRIEVGIAAIYFTKPIGSHY